MMTSWRQKKNHRGFLILIMQKWIKKKPFYKGFKKWVDLQKISSLTVLSSSISQNWVFFGYFSFSIRINIASVCQLYKLLWSSFLVLKILLPSIKKCCHDSESEWSSKSPFHGLARTAPHLSSEVNVLVAIATNFIMPTNLLKCVLYRHKTFRVSSKEGHTRYY